MAQWTGKSRGNALGHRIFIAVINGVGVRAAYALLTLVVPYFVLFGRGATQASWHYQRGILRKGRAAAFCGLFRHFYTFGQVLVDRAAIAHGLKPKYEFGYVNHDEFLRILDSGRGAIIVSAHFGGWAVAQTFFSRYADRMHVALLDADYQRIKEIHRRGADGPKFNVIPMSADGGIESLLKMKEVLERGEFVCMQADRLFAVPARDKAQPFMGAGAYFPSSPFRLARAMGAPLVIMFAPRMRNKTGYTFVFKNITDTAGETASNLRRTYVECLEEQLREHPYQWFNFYDFWTDENTRRS